MKQIIAMIFGGKVYRHIILNMLSSSPIPLIRNLIKRKRRRSLKWVDVLDRINSSKKRFIRIYSQWLITLASQSRFPLRIEQPISGKNLQNYLLSKIVKPNPRHFLFKMSRMGARSESLMSRSCSRIFLETFIF